MSQKASGYERIEGDRYFTPPWPVEALLSVESFAGKCLDPCAGGWDIVRTLRSKGLDAEGFDIHPDSPVVRDFLPFGALGEIEATFYPNLITNPPYGQQGRLAVKFIEHALHVTKPIGGKVAMLLRVDFDSANGRRPIFGDHPAFAAKYTLTKRIRWENLPQSASGPTENHAWYIWSWEHAKRGGSRHYGYLP